MMSVSYVTFDEWVAWARAQAAKRRPPYYAMYSSVLGGIVTDPVLMLVPVDDHLVHRGDGVFDTCKCVAGAIYNWNAHLTRLRESARGIELKIPWSDEDITEVLTATVRAGGHRDCLIRVLLSRGPGSLGVNPYDCPEPALYIVVSELPPPFMKVHPTGARAATSRYTPKVGMFARIKSANYLLNVLMKKEAVDRGVDFVVTFDEEGFMAEGATENFGIVMPDRRLQVPRPERILSGTTMLRVLQLAQTLVESGELKSIEHADISRETAAAASEMLIFGTTPDVTAVVEFDGQPIGDGKPGPIYAKLSSLLLDDIYNNPQMRTPVW